MGKELNFLQNFKSQALVYECKGGLSSELTLRLSASLPSGACKVSGFVCSVSSEAWTGLVPFAFYTCTGKKALLAKTCWCS